MNPTLLPTRLIVELERGSDVLRETVDVDTPTARVSELRAAILELLGHGAAPIGAEFEPESDENQGYALVGIAKDGQARLLDPNGELRLDEFERVRVTPINVLGAGGRAAGEGA
jgi:hypothetical protein